MSALHNHNHSSSSPCSFPSCFRPSTTTEDHLQPPPPPLPPPLPLVSGNPNLTTCLYHTNHGLFSLTWSRSFPGHCLHLHLHPTDDPYYSSSPVSVSNPLPLSTLSFHLRIKPFTFWRKNGSKKLKTKTATTPKVQIFWDLSRAKFGSGPEPQSEFYIAIVVDGEMTLLVGDCAKEAYAKTRAERLQPEKAGQVLILRREHVFGNRVYSTKARFGGKNREISIDCRMNEDAKLCFSVDNKRVLQIKRLKWKFRGNERIEVDGVPIQVSWDVYNWLFEDKKSNNNKHAVFMFRFENLDHEEHQTDYQQDHPLNEKNGVVSWQQNSCSFGINGIEWRKMRKSFLRSARSSSSSSISMSSASSGCSSSVMEWASMEESELSNGPTGFSLLVYAWKK